MEFPEPGPPRSTWEADPVFSGIQAAYAEHHIENPEFLGIHYTDAASVEECWRLRRSGKSIGYESLAYIPHYSAWLAEQDWTDAYQRHKANLQLIGLNDQDKRWVLKNPFHLVGLDAAMSVYPDALVVQTHRDPRVAIASACSLSAEATRGWVHGVRGTGHRPDAARHALWRVGAVPRGAVEVRPAQFVDVQYDDFVADPAGTVRGIYQAFDLPWMPEVAERVESIDAESRSGPRRPSHRYSLADYGLTEDEVLSRF